MSPFRFRPELQAITDFDRVNPVLPCEARVVPSLKSAAADGFSSILESQSLTLN